MCTSREDPRKSVDRFFSHSNCAVQILCRTEGSVYLQRLFVLRRDHVVFFLCGDVKFFVVLLLGHSEVSQSLRHLGGNGYTRP